MATNVRIGVNGAGRIGRLVIRAALVEQQNQVTVALINDPFMDTEYMAYLLKYDSVHGQFPGEILARDTSLVVTVAGTGKQFTIATTK